MAEGGAAQVAGELVAAFNAADWPRFRATLGDDLVYEEAGTGRRVEGGDAYLQLSRPPRTPGRPRAWRGTAASRPR